ncbi:MAG: hypothetical protein ACK54P_11685, partial [Bacteroidota bacterium]
GYTVKGTTRTAERFPVLAGWGILPVLNRFDESTDAEGILAISESDAAIVTVPWSRQISDRENAALFTRIAHTLAFEDIQRVIVISSTSVYPDDLSVCTEEDADPGHPLVMMEKEFLTRIPSVAVVRFAGLIGPMRHPARFLAARRHVPSPDAPVNLIHRDDCIGVISNLLEGRQEGIFNACAPSHPGRREFYTEACRRLGIEPPQFAERGEHGGREVSIVKLLEETHYSFVHPDLYEALDHCLSDSAEKGNR